jgi:hypothetical protein
LITLITESSSLSTAAAIWDSFIEYMDELSLNRETFYPYNSKPIVSSLEEAPNLARLSDSDVVVAIDLKTGDTFTMGDNTEYRVQSIEGGIISLKASTGEVYRWEYTRLLPANLPREVAQSILKVMLLEHQSQTLDLAHKAYLNKKLGAHKAQFIAKVSLPTSYSGSQTPLGSDSSQN